MSLDRHPRTMREAFGPYTDSRLQPMADESRVERIAGIVLAVVIGILLAMAVLHWWSA